MGIVVLGMAKGGLKVEGVYIACGSRVQVDVFSAASRRKGHLNP